jgi:hypothetical protein
MSLLEALLTDRAIAIVRHAALAVLGFVASFLIALAPYVATLPAHAPGALLAIAAVVAALWGASHLALVVIHLNDVPVGRVLASESSRSSA